MNPDLRGVALRKAFDTEAYQLLINKFQTGFDQSQLVAMYELAILIKTMPEFLHGQVPSSDF